MAKIQIIHTEPKKQEPKEYILVDGKTGKPISEIEHEYKTPSAPSNANTVISWSIDDIKNADK